METDTAGGPRVGAGPQAGRGPQAGGAPGGSHASLGLQADAAPAAPIATVSSVAPAADAAPSKPHRADSGAAMRLGLFDLHAHLDFDPDPSGAARRAAACGLGVFSATVEPLSYEPTVDALADCSNVRVGLGLHPWWVREGAAGHVQIEAFERLAPDARFIGEVGLDLGRAHAHTAAIQRAAFEHVARACAGGGKVLSIHAVHAAGEVMDAMERAGAMRGNACVFHWFSGTSDELHRALELGFYCSVNPRMLASRRGRAYARAIPGARLLLETDLPAQGEPYDAPARAEQLSAMLDTLAELRAVPREGLACAIACTSRDLLGFAY